MFKFGHKTTGLYKFIYLKRLLLVDITGLVVLTQKRDLRTLSGGIYLSVTLKGFGKRLTLYFTRSSSEELKFSTIELGM